MDTIKKILRDNIENFELEYRKQEKKLEERAEELREGEIYAAFLKEPLKEKQILFWCKGYQACADTPRYIFEYLYQTYGNEYKYVWVVKSMRKLPKGLPEQVGFVQWESMEFWKALACSKYLVGNVLLPVSFVKRQGQVYLNSMLGLDALYKKRTAAAGNTHTLAMLEMLKTDYLIADAEEMTEALYTKEYQLGEIYQGKVICMDSVRASYMKGQAAAKNEKAKCVVLIRNKDTYQWFKENWDSLIGEEMDYVLVRDQNCSVEGTDICDIIAQSDMVISDRSNYLRDAAAYGCKVCCWKQSQDYLGFDGYDVVEDAEDLKHYLVQNSGYRRMDTAVAADVVKQAAEIFIREAVCRSLCQNPEKKHLLLLADWKLPREKQYAIKRALDYIDTEKYDVTLAAPATDAYTQEELKQLPDTIRKISYRGKMILTRKEYICYRLMEKNPGLIQQYPEIEEFVSQIMQREWRRRWGNPACDVIVLFGDKLRQYLLAISRKEAQKVLAAEQPLAVQKERNPEQWQHFWDKFDKLYVPAFCSDSEIHQFGQENCSKVLRQQLLFPKEYFPENTMEKVEIAGNTYLIADKWRTDKEREQMYLVQLPEMESCLVNTELPANEERKVQLTELLADKKSVILYGRYAEEYKDCVSGKCEVLDDFAGKRLYMLPTAKAFFVRIAGYVGDGRLEYDMVGEIYRSLRA